MKTTKKFSTAILIVVSVLFLYHSELAAQNSVVIKTPEAFAEPTQEVALQVASDNKGLLIPRVFLTDINLESPIAALPALGLLVYNTNPSVIGGIGTGFYYWNGSWWIGLESTSDLNPQYWGVAGNTGTNPAINFIGTTNDADIKLACNVSSCGIIGVRNTSLGANSYGFYGFGGLDNTSCGNAALLSLTNGNYNTALGYQVLGPNTSGSNNTGAGVQAFYSNNTGSQNVAVGMSNSTYNTNGSYNTAIGGSAGFTNSQYCTSMGYYAGSFENYNAIAIGSYALTNCDNCAMLGGSPTSPGPFSEVKVGIGTSSPRATLDIKQSAGTTAGIRLTEYNGTYNWRIDVDNASDINFYYNGTIKAYIEDGTGNYTAVSDSRLKKDIQLVGTVMPQLMQLQPKVYHYKHQNDSDPLVYGFLAQQVEKVFPDFVRLNPENGLKGLDYSGFGIIAIKAIQEQQAQIDARNKEIDELEKRLAILETEFQ